MGAGAYPGGSRKWLLGLTAVEIFAVILQSGCGGKPRAPLEAAAPSPATVRATDFVLCIDNSKSITPPQQILIREIAMLLADLAEPGDRVSLITFGRDARLAASVTISGAQAKMAFKGAVQKEIKFSENYSDIRAGLRVMAEEAPKLFRPSGAVRAPILLTDGKLEPADHNPAGAFAEMQEFLHGPLAQTSIYAVVLGDTTSHDPILPNLNGLALMQQYVASGPEYFYHARSLDQLLDVTVSILSKAKGISSLGEQGKTRFKIDRTVESMTLIVRKKSSEGKVYCTSSDIRLKRVQPEPAVILSSTSQPQGGPLGALYWSSDYQYFDLITVNKPQEGIWEVALADGKSVDVLSKVVTTIDLQYAARNFYYQNERAAISAWLFDNKKGVVSKGPYRVQAHLADGDNLADSPVYVGLHPDAEGQHFLLEAPLELDKALGRQGKPGRVSMEIVADQPDGDPWFVRTSAPVSIVVVPPFIEWLVASRSYTKIPFWRRSIDLGAAFVPASKHSAYLPDFESPPQLRLEWERFEEGKGTYQKGAEEILQRSLQDGWLRYVWKAALPAAGIYRYSYQLTGSTRSGGPFAIASPWYEMRVRFPWPELAMAALLVLMVLSSATARLKGRLNITRPDGAIEKVSIAPAKSFDSKLLSLNGLRFRLQAKRFLFVKSSIRLTILKGKATLNKRELGPGETVSLPARGTHVLTASGQDGELNIRVTVTI
jgi:hypothetical protein